MLNSVDSAFTNNTSANPKTSQRAVSTHGKTESWKNCLLLIIIVETLAFKPKPSESKAYTVSILFCYLLQPDGRLA